MKTYHVHALDCASRTAFAVNVDQLDHARALFDMAEATEGLEWVTVTHRPTQRVMLQVGPGYRFDWRRESNAQG